MRKNGGDGKAKPLTDDARQANYERQNGRFFFMTDRQIRRYWHKVNLRLRRQVSNLDGGR